MYIHYVFNRQTRLVEFEQQSKNFSKLQERFRNVVSEKKVRETELTKTYSEFEDSLSTLDNYAKQ